MEMKWIWMGILPSGLRMGRLGWPGQIPYGPRTGWLSGWYISILIARTDSILSLLFTYVIYPKLGEHLPLTFLALPVHPM